MRVDDSAIAYSAVTAGGTVTAGGELSARGGTLLAMLGVLAFSLTFPATSWGLTGLGPWSLVFCRAGLAGLIASGCLAARGARVPARRHWPGLLVVAAGTVMGFPLLTTLALTMATTSHAAVVVGLLPLTTAVWSAMRMGARPSRAFWAAAVAGAVVVVSFAVQQTGGAPTVGDLYLFAALLVCAAGYTEGGRLASSMPGWQVSCWSLVICLPASLAGAAVSLTAEPARLGAHAIAGVLWLAVGSQLLGLLAWYRGMAVIGVTRASQLQLAQPTLTLVWSVLLLGERLDLAAPVAAAAVMVCVGVTQRSQHRARGRTGDRIPRLFAF